jgi:hypothetical protein
MADLHDPSAATERRRVALLGLLLPIAVVSAVGFVLGLLLHGPALYAAATIGGLLVAGALIAVVLD